MQSNQMDLLSYQPPRFSREGMSEEQRAIIGMIEDRKGKSMALPVAALTRATSIPDRRARDVVKSLVEEHRIPIGSCTAGFYIAETEEEIQEVYHTFLSWAFSVLRRARAFKQSSHLDEILGQLRLELGPDASQ
jgi:hypothetical protein